MKKVLLTLLGIIVVVGVLAGAGFAGYRIGYARGTNGDTAIFVPRQGFDPQGMPMHGFGNDFDPHDMPMHNFGKNSERGFNRWEGPGGFGMMHQGRGFGFFSPIFFLVRIAFWGLIIWLAYKFIKGSGWQLSLTRQNVDSHKVETTTPNDQAPKTDQ